MAASRTFNVEAELFYAIEHNRPLLVESLLSNPSLDVNWRNPLHQDLTSLHLATKKKYKRIVQQLLAHPKIDPNVRNASQETPFIVAACLGTAEIVVEFLRCAKVDVNVVYGPLRYTPWLLAVRENHVDAVRWMIASGREVDFQAEVDDRSLGEMRNALGLARKCRLPAMAQLLREFYVNQPRTRFLSKRKLRFPEIKAMELFALVVFLCDGYLRVPSGARVYGGGKVRRFFNIASKLPMDLQMMLCNRVYNNPKNWILQRDADAAIQAMAYLLII